MNWVETPVSTEFSAHENVELAPRRLAIALQSFVGLLLIVAATLKTYQAMKTTPEMAWSARLFELGLIEFELLVGGMLLLNLKPRIAWSLALVAFTIFTGVSVKNAIAKVPACGCFGPAAVDPRIMAGVDALIVMGLIATGPRRPSVRLPGGLWRAGRGVIIAMMLLAVGVNVYAAVPKRGLVAEAGGVHDFGRMPADDAGKLEHTFIVRNTSMKPIRVTGYTSSCGCTAAEIPPGDIDPGTTAAVTLHINWSHAAGNTSSEVTLKTDNRWTPVVRLTVSGFIVPKD